MSSTVEGVPVFWQTLSNGPVINVRFTVLNTETSPNAPEYVTVSYNNIKEVFGSRQDEITRFIREKLKTHTRTKRVTVSYDFR